MSDAGWTVLTAAVFLAGCGAGRFVNVAAVRFGPRDRLGDQLRSLWRPAPHERALTAGRGWSRLPVVGWLLPGHPLAAAPRRDRLGPAAVELAAGALLAGLFWQEVVNWQTWDPAGRAFLPDVARAFECPWDATFTWALHSAMLLSLLAASVVDLRRMLIPDGTTVPAALLALAASLSGRLWLVPVWFEEGRLSRGQITGGGEPVPAWVAAHPHLHGLAASVAGIAAGAGICWVVRWIGARVLGREAMGLGDVILLGMVGAFLGWQPVVIAFFLAPAAALVVILPAKLIAAVRGRGGGREFPYGPWLAAAAAFVALFWKETWDAAGAYFALGPVLPATAVVVAGLLAGLLWLMRAGKRALGLEPATWPALPAWGGADTLGYLAAEGGDLDRPAAAPGRPRRGWDGAAAGRGRLHADRWRHAAPGSPAARFRSPPPRKPPRR